MWRKEVNVGSIAFLWDWRTDNSKVWCVTVHPNYATPICFTRIQYPKPNKSPIHLWALALQLILNNEPQGESGDHKAHTSFRRQKPDWALSHSLFFSVVYLRIRLSSAMANFSTYIFNNKIKEKRRKCSQEDWAVRMKGPVKG